MKGAEVLRFEATRHGEEKFSSSSIHGHYTAAVTTQTFDVKRGVRWPQTQFNGAVAVQDQMAALAESYAEARNPEGPQTPFIKDALPESSTPKAEITASNTLIFALSLPAHASPAPTAQSYATLRSPPVCSEASYP